MKLFILAILILLPSLSFAKNNELPNDCAHFKEVSEADSVILNKKEFIQLGECLAIHTIKRKPIVDLAMLCDEVIEYQSGPLGTLSLSKLEAIYIGQCSGIISYIYQRYNEESTSKNYSPFRRDKKYFCIKGMDAVHVLSKNKTESSSRSDIRDLLCEAR